MHSNRTLKAVILFFLCLILLLSSLAACENRPAETAVPNTAVPSTLTPTLTPTPELNLPELAARVCQGEAVPQAADYVNSPGAEHKLYVIGADGAPSQAWNYDLPDNLKAGSVEELEAVLCLGEPEFIRSSCGMYADKTDPTKFPKELFMDFYIMKLNLVAAKTGEIIVSQEFGSEEVRCPETIESNDPRLTDGMHGAPVTWDTVWNDAGWNRDASKIIHQAVVNPTAAPTGTPLPPGPSVEDWAVDVKDDFSDSDLWELDPGETVAKGVLTWLIKPTQFIYRSRANHWTTPRYENIYARLVVRHTSGSAADAYGLAFRMDGRKQLAFLIQDDGNFRIQTEEYYDYYWRASTAIKPGEWNTLEVISFQGMLYLSINGTQVYQGKIDPATGFVGLAVIVEEISDRNARSIFEFDEFEVRYP